jgi:sulfur-oxidizing protein SoxZ
MTQDTDPRVRIPEIAAPGEIIEIKTLISHEMENGQRKDPSGRPIPRDIVNRFSARFNGKEVFRADWFPAISANPFQSFFFRAKESGTFEFAWTDDNGTVSTLTAPLRVS